MTVFLLLGTGTLALLGATGGRLSLLAGRDIDDWYAHGGYTMIGTITGDLDDIRDAGTGAAGIGAACQKLGLDVVAAQGLAPVPDSLAQAHYVAALNQFARASTDCAAGTRPPDTGLLSTAAAAFKIGNDEFDQLNVRLDQVRQN